MSNASPSSYWLLKAEPDARIVKGKDVKFSVDDFERVKTSPWEGVRNYEARNLMKEMKSGDKALFYHSNCKNPGVAAFAEVIPDVVRIMHMDSHNLKVSKEAYPDFTAWDASHPYFDAKSDSTNPKWFMADLTFVSRATNFIPLSLLRYLAEISYANLPEELKYLTEADLQAIKGMDLVTRGRLSVQRVKEDAWKTITLMAEKGGWDALDLKVKKGSKGKAKNTAPKDVEDASAEEDERPPKKAKRSTTQKATKSKPRGKKAVKEVKEDDGESSLTEIDDEPQDGGETVDKKRKRGLATDASSSQVRRTSSRNKK